MSNARLLVAGIAVVAVAGLAIGFVRGQTEGHAQYLLSLDHAERGFATARKSCESLSGEEWGRCITTALAVRWRTMANAEVEHRNTPESYRVQRITNAGADLLMRTQECIAEPEATQGACEADALDAYRQALAREANPELAERNCSLSGCPNRVAPAQRVAAKARGV